MTNATEAAQTPKLCSLKTTIKGLAEDIAALGTGALAQLRRMDPNGPGTGTFWQLAIKHDLRTDSEGLMLVRILALLTPKGASGPWTKTLHVKEKAFGAVLFHTLRGDLKPSDINDRHLLRFLSLPFDKRPEALERFARRIGAKGHKGVNCIDIAALLFSDDVKHTRKLAADFYKQIYQAEKKSDTDCKDDDA